MKSYSSRVSHFNSVPNVNLPRSTFRRPSNLKTSFNTSVVKPIYCQPVLPGDTVDLNMHNFVRLMPIVAPIMDNLYVDTHWFFVPNRLVWDNWQRFMGEQRNPTDSTDFLIPQVVSPATTGWPLNSPAESFGIRAGVPNISTSALPLRAYNLIWNEWFRDQNLQQSRPVNTGDGPDLATDYITLPYNKFHDYFTSCLPFPQKGPSVQIPVTASSGVIPVTLSGTNSQALARRASNGTLVNNAAFTSMSINAGGGIYADAAAVDDNMFLDPNGTLAVNLSTALTGTINSLRQAEAIQTLLERDARGGTRYTEMIRAHFGVISPDARVQRPEYLGGNSVPVNVTPVMQNSETGATPQGNLAGNGLLSSSNAQFIKSFTEHGYLIGVVCARSDLHYQQGTDRDWFKRTKYDFYFPALAHLGEQAVLNEEIFTQGTATDKQVFGYQERWAEYKYATSRITGTLNSDAPASLDVWHLAQDYPALPLLNDSFIKDATPEPRMLAVPSEATFVGDFQFDTKWTRVMPLYSIPHMGARL